MTIRQTVPQEAYQLLRSGHRYIDVRTQSEFAAGHPAGAVNIPVVFPDPATRQMTVNPDFVTVVAAHFSKDARIVVGCQAGARSQRAAEMLVAAGFPSVLNMQGGFGGSRDASGHTIVAGWSECGLPVSSECTDANTYSALRRAIAEVR
jgi:rhodanese-related sulfurtransferase